MVDKQNRVNSDIYKIPLLGFIFKNPTFIFILKTIILALFIYAIVLGFVEPTKAENSYTTMLFWTLFWPFFIVITLPSLGRIFCGICPHGFLGKYITKFGLNKKMPKFLENRYIGITLIIIGFWAVYYIAPGTYKTPYAAAIFFSVLTALAVVLFYLYKDMSYCKSICPIGSLLRGFSKVSFTKLQTYKDSCGECRTFECAKACGYNLKPFTFEKRNDMTDCTLCMDCSSACEAVGFHIVKPSKPLLKKFKYNKPEIWAIILITAAISISMSFHHALGRVAISEQYIWSQTGLWLESIIGIKGLDYIGISAFFYAMLITIVLATIGMKLASMVLNEKYEKTFYTLSYAFAPLFIIGGLSHTFEFFFLHHYSNIINGFIDGFILNMQNVAPLATRKDKWLHFFNIMNYIAVIWGMFILYKRVNFFENGVLKKGLAFLLAGSLIWFYLFLQLYKGYAFSTYGAKKMGHSHGSHSTSLFQSVNPKEATLLQKGEDKSSCHTCGMKLTKFYKTNHAAVHKDENLQFCSIHCLTDEINNHKRKLEQLKVVDISTLKFIQTKEAFYVVGSSKKGTMSMVSKYGFSSREEASKFAKKYGGEIVNFEQAMKIAKKDFK